MTGATVIISRVIMGGHVDDCARFDGKAAIFKEEWIFFPQVDDPIQHPTCKPASAVRSSVTNFAKMIFRKL
jgi:hypothetical protein